MARPPALALAAALLAGCAAGAPPPARPALEAGDVVLGLALGEAAPRVCFRAAKWAEVLAYLRALEARAGGLDAAPGAGPN